MYHITVQNGTLSVPVKKISKNSKSYKIVAFELLGWTNTLIRIRKTSGIAYV